MNNSSLDGAGAADVPVAVSGRPTRGVLLIAAGVLVVLIALSGGYGYHRDELYFLAAGRRLAMAYPDQGLVTPLIAALMNWVAPGSLLVLRLPSAIAAAGIVVLTGKLCHEVGGGSRVQAMAACCSAVAAIVLFTGHTLSTTTFDLLVWTAVTYLAVRAVRSDRAWLWPVAGAVLGVGLENKPLPVFLAVAVVAGLVISGPRRVLREPRFWLGAGIAIALWSPWLGWQAAHGWPQLAVSGAIAAGGSTSSAPWWQIVPFQALLAGPPLAIVWIAGLARLFRDPAVRNVRFLAWAWVLLAVVFMVVGGKPYYLAGLLPLLNAAGAGPVIAWVDHGRARLRRTLLWVVVAISAVAGTVIALPVLPARLAGPIVAMNPDVGETIGWPQLVDTVADVASQLPDRYHLVILTANDGEAGAIDRYGSANGLPAAYSGHNAYGLWGPPPDIPGPVIAVGFEPAQAAWFLRGCNVAARLHNTAGIDNHENGKAVLACTGTQRPWSAQWPRIRHLN